MLGIRRSDRDSDANSPDPMLNGEHLFAERFVPKCRTVFDVGARTDDYLVRLNQDCDFHLFEPMSESFQQLQQKVTGNSRVRAVNTALGNEKGEVLIHPDTQSIHKRPHGESTPTTIVIQTLDEYCQQAEVESIDFMKIDVEGYELDVLRGGEGMIRNHVRTIQFEYGGTYQEVGISLGEVFEFLGDGWSIYRVCPKGLVEVAGYSPQLENYQYANFVASRERLDDYLAPANSLLKQIIRQLTSAA